MGLYLVSSHITHTQIDDTYKFELEDHFMLLRNLQTIIIDPASLLRSTLQGY